jgi:5-methylcytosine-specific restriction endonuclease McrA
MASRLDAISERDGGRCLWCGATPWPRDRSVEHLCRRSRGGAGEGANLALACRRCNRDRRSRSASAFARERREEGMEPDFPRLRDLLERLAASGRRAHRDYAARELRHLPSAESA